jgi:hypothetical protein
MVVPPWDHGDIPRFIISKVIILVVLNTIEEWYRMEIP